MKVIINGAYVEVSSISELITSDNFKRNPIKIYDVSGVELDILSEVKNEALKRIEVKADEYQTLFLGVNSAQREARFAQNLSSAKRLLDDGYTESVLDQQQQLADYTSMEVQAISQSNKTGGSLKTPIQFAQWIVDWQPKTTLIAGYIESFLVDGKAGLMALTDVEQVEPYLETLVSSAQSKFSELMS